MDQDVCQQFFCRCDKEVIEALAGMLKDVGCPDGNPGCSD